MPPWPLRSPARATILDCALELRDARHGERIHVHHGTREAPGRLVALASDLWQLRLDRPLLAADGDRLVVRRSSPAATLGGGVVPPPASAPRSILVGHAMTTTDRPDPQTYTALPHLLAAAKERFIAETHRRLYAAGYTEIAGNGVVFRWLEPDGSRLAEMVECSGMTKQAFGEHVASLEQHGYLTRVPDPADGRGKLVVPTPRGRAAHAEARRIFAEIEAEWAGAVGAESLAALRATLERIAALPS